MRLLGFAHLTVVGNFLPALIQGGLVTRSPKLTASFANLPNPIQKQSHQLKSRQTYSLDIFNGLVPLEVLSFPESKQQTPVEADSIGVSVNGSDVTLSSRSFGYAFSSGLTTLFGIREPTVRVVASQKPRFVSFAFDSHAAEFSNFLDEEGKFVSLAFFVRGLSGHDLTKFRTAFSIPGLKIGEATFDVCFVRLGGCWVELLDRTSKNDR